TSGGEEIRMRNFLGWALVSVMAPATMVGCGGDGPATIDTGLPESTLLVDLTDAQSVEACIAFETWEREESRDLLSKRELCTVFAAAFTEDAASCEAAVTACLEREPEPEMPEDETPAEECADETAPELMASCDVTVGELEDCANQRVDATLRAIGELD